MHRTLLGLQQESRLGFPLVRLAIVDSTQAFLKRHRELGYCAVMADAQTAGRGRGENTWISDPGAGLWMSAALPVPDMPPGLVLQRAMAHVADLLLNSGIELGLKWPNDLVARKDGQLVKVGGIIGETVGDRMILGLGLNLSNAPKLEKPFPPVSLADLGVMPVPDSQNLALAVLERWQDFSNIVEPGFRWPLEGDEIRWEEGEGVCRGWEDDGRLRIETARGLERLSVGDVSGLAQ
jgi:BirA family biotin operon repressor/biotin-[acetyl-CoA-carboxylase] ligase